jgi:translocation and assembly module TamB
MTRRALLLVKLVAGLAAFLLLMGLVVVWVVQTPWFHEQVRARIVLELENATGGRVELGAFHFDWSRLRAEVRDLTIHGLEPEGTQPLFKTKLAAVGLKLISALRRKIDVAYLHIESPVISVTVDKDGRTNVPEPKVRRSTKKPIERFFDMAVGEYKITAGSFSYDSRKWPVEVAGHELELRLDFERAGPAYLGEFHTLRARLSRPLPVPLAADADLTFRLEKDRLEVKNLALSTSSSSLSGSGVVSGFHPFAGRFELRGRQSLAELLLRLPLPIVPAGSAGWTATAEFNGSDWNARGRVEGNGLAYRMHGLNIKDAGVRARFAVNAVEASFEDLEAELLGGRFTGSGTLRNWSRIEVSGEASGFELGRLNEARQAKPMVWSSLVSGPVQIHGGWGAADGEGWQVAAELALEAAEGGVPLSGSLDLGYDTRSGRLAFGPSTLELPLTRVHFSGCIDEHIAFGLFSNNLDDLLPAIALLSPDAPDQLPLRLERGSARAEGRLSGSWASPRVEASVSLGPFTADGHAVKYASAKLQATPSQLRLTEAHVDQQTLSLTGELEVDLDEWRLLEGSRIRGTASLRDVPLEAVLAENKLSYPLKGQLSVNANVEGTWSGPRASGTVKMVKPELWGEPFDSLDADLRYSSHLLEVVNGRLREAGSSLDFSGSLERSGTEWRTSLAQFRASAKNMRIRQITLLDAPRDLDGGLSGDLHGSARLDRGNVSLTSLDGRLDLDSLAVAGRPAGKAALTAVTRNQLVTLSLNGAISGSTIQGQGEWTLGGNAYGLGQVKVSRLTLSALQDLGLLGGPGKSLPVRGTFDGEIGFSGPILQPDRWSASAKITMLEIEPSAGPVNGRRVLLRNRDPLSGFLDSNGLHVQSAHIIGEGTDLVAAGTVAFRARSTWNLQLRGSLDLPALAILEPDLLATGVSTLDAIIRGSLEQPQVHGQLEVKDASFYLRGVPNGLEKANGVILFDRNRASLENFTAQTGGGDLRLTGFIGFGGDQLVYRLQAVAQRVRVRYPEAVSTTFDSTLNLTGTAAQSMLSGLVRVTKMGITPKTDIGSLLAQTGGASSPGPPNDFLRNMQLDVRVETSPDAELQTTLTRDIQPEADLRLRGSPERPALLGRVSVNQGEIQFFGNRYTITNGDISFFNPVKVEPVLNLDLETRVRGITVTINFSGPIGKLNVSYRSDPPLQSTEIIALLTVGRAPGTAVTPTSITQNQGFLQSGSNSLLGQAVAAPLTGRLQRFFGVSRLKIDPELTGVTNTPQARLTLEQQLSRDITITYITNLNRTQQQIVRLQWDFSRDYSMIAVRDDNGIFGVDFQYRKRFK